MSKTSETTLEKTAMDWFETLGWQTAFGPDISPDLPAPNSSRPVNVMITIRSYWSENSRPRLRISIRTSRRMRLKRPSGKLQGQTRLA